MSAAEQFAPDLREALDSAAGICRRAMADYRAGLIDEEELRQLLFRGGLVQWPDEVWLLDLSTNRWWRYDGVALGADAAAGATTGDGPLRAVVEELTRDARIVIDGGER